MTDPRLKRNACVLLPCTTDIGVYTAVLAALSGVVERFPSLLKEYARTGFERGERIRVLPTGHVYEFGGFFETGSVDFFRLQVLGCQKDARSFPLTEIIRLEKTARLLPKGKLNTDLGEFFLSDLDRLLRIRTGGNQALLANEIILVTTQADFANFLETTFINRIDGQQKPHRLSEVLPWGTVNPDGMISFSQSGAAAGEPLIGISAKADSVAIACRLQERLAPRVIIDGASRISDLQALDDIIDYSRALVLTGHSQVDTLEKLLQRGFSIWKLPGDSTALLEGTNVLKRFRTACRTAADFSIDVVNCESHEIERIATLLLEALQAVEETDSDGDTDRLFSLCYSRLLEVSSIIHDPEEAEISVLTGRIEEVREKVTRQELWLPPEASRSLQTFCECLESLICEHSAEYRLLKQTALLQAVEELDEAGANFLVAGAGAKGFDSAFKLLKTQLRMAVEVRKLSNITPEDDLDVVLLTGWPKARNFFRLCNSYSMRHVTAIAFGFETSWFHSVDQRRRSALGRWNASEEVVREITGLVNTQLLATSVPKSREVPDFDEILRLETRLSRVRKGSSWAGGGLDERRSAKYVGFLGSGYSYLTEGHSVPRINELVLGGGILKKKVPLVKIEELDIGDIIIFRASSDSDKDVIRLIAENICGEAAYLLLKEKASRWKDAVRSLGTNSEEVFERLVDFGFTKTQQTARNWLKNSDLIGPSEPADLLVIAQAAEDSRLEKETPDVWKAISSVRGWHQKAGFKLSELLIAELPGKLPELDDHETYVDLSFGRVVVVGIEEIGENYEDRSYTEVNHMLWEEV